MENRNKYGMIRDLNFFCKESFRFGKLGFLLSLLLVPAGVAKSLAFIVVPKIVIDAIEVCSSEREFLLRILLVTAVIAVSSVVEQLAKNTMEHSMNAFVLVRLNELWIDKVSDMDYGVFTSETGKQAASKARTMLEGTTRWGIGTYIPRLLELAASVLGFLLYGALLVTVHPIVLAALIAAYAVSLAVTLHFEKKKELLREDAAKAERKLNYFAYNTRGLSIAKDIRVCSIREWIKQLSTAARLEKKQVEERKQSYQTAALILNGVIVLLRDGLIYAVLLWLALREKITVGDLALYAAAVNGLGEWLSQLTRSVGEFREADCNVADFRRFLDLPDGRKRTGEKQSFPAAPGIELDGVSFSYDGENEVLHDVSLRVEPGEKIAVVGSNGAGKTTLIKLICGLLTPTVGQIRIGGVPVSSLSREDCARAVSAVFQDSALLPVSIRRNIVMNDDRIDEERLAKVITLVGLDEKIASLENGMDTPLVSHIAENGTELSGGEKQKLFLARAVYKDAPVLILDEPTAAMDAIAEQNVYLRYNELSADRTAFFISHRLSSTRFCDRIILIDGGAIRELGTHDELMEKGGLYREMYDLQSRYYREEVAAQ